MPLARPTARAETPPAPCTIARADVTGMTPTETHAAILGALDAGVLTVTAATGMIDSAIIDAAVAGLADTRKTITAHAPYTLSSAEVASCLTEGTDGPPWPCPTYRGAADTIADGLTA